MAGDAMAPVERQPYAPARDRQRHADRRADIDARHAALCCRPRRRRRRRCAFPSVATGAGQPRRAIAERSPAVAHGSRRPVHRLRSGTRPRSASRSGRRSPCGGPARAPSSADPLLGDEVDGQPRSAANRSRPPLPRPGLGTARRPVLRARPGARRRAIGSRTPACDAPSCPPADACLRLPPRATTHALPTSGAVPPGCGAGPSVAGARIGKLVARPGLWPAGAPACVACRNSMIRWRRHWPDWMPLHVSSARALSERLADTKRTESTRAAGLPIAVAGGAAIAAQVPAARVGHSIAMRDARPAAQRRSQEAERCARFTAVERSFGRETDAARLVPDGLRAAQHRDVAHDRQRRAAISRSTLPTRKPHRQQRLAPAIDAPR